MAKILPSDTQKLAPKVRWSSLAAALVTLVLTGLPGILSDTDIVTGVPDWITALAAAVLTGAAGAISGYAAPHQDRHPPLDASAKAKTRID